MLATPRATRFSFRPLSHPQKSVFVVLVVLLWLLRERSCVIPHVLASLAALHISHLAANPSILSFALTGPRRQRKGCPLAIQCPTSKVTLIPNWFGCRPLESCSSSWQVCSFEGSLDQITRFDTSSTSMSQNEGWWSGYRFWVRFFRKYAFIEPKDMEIKEIKCSNNECLLTRACILKHYRKTIKNLSRWK